LELAPATRVVVRRDADAYAAARAALAAVTLPTLTGRRVLLKPNAGRQVGPGLGITTNPEVVAAACDFFLERGALPAVGDSTIAGVKPLDCLESTGIAAVAHARNIPVLDLDAKPARRVPIKQGAVLDHLKVCGAVAEFAYVVSLPVMKTHMHCGVSLSLKNMKGCLRGREKVRLHQLPPSPDNAGVKTLDLALADLATILAPDLALIDGSVGMQGLGPSAGSQISPQLVVASTDYLAADAVAAALMGFAPEEIMHLRLAAQRGLGVIDVAHIVVDPPDWRDWVTPFERPPQKLSLEFNGVNVLDRDSCSACLSTVLLFLQRYYATFADYLPLTLAIGKGHAALPPDALCIGNCTAIAAKDHVIVKGCPPVASDILQKLQAAQAQRRTRS
jgi:uncharacterized protein (DUF362 family)